MSTNLNRIDALIARGHLACTTCHSIRIIRTEENTLRCTDCGKSYPISDGIPVFKTIEKNSATEHSQNAKKGGIAERLFNSPQFYHRFVQLKHWVYSDATLGVNEYIQGREVLDVGCGPTIGGYWGEYEPSKAKAYTGIELSVNFAIEASRTTSFESTFVAGSATELPFANKSFDTTILAFTLHHVTEPPELLINELKRVTRSHIVIFDHLAHTNPLPRAIQHLYWRNMDGGTHYLQEHRWDQLLSTFKIVKRIRTGAIFGHVIKMVVQVDSPSI